MSFAGSTNGATSNWMGQRDAQTSNGNGTSTDTTANAKSGVGKNDDGIDDKMLDKLWEDVKAGGDGTGTTQTQQQPTTQTQQQTPEEQVAAHLKDVGLGQFKLTDSQKAELQQGNYNSVEQAIESRTAAAYMKAMSGSKVLIDRAVQDAIAKAQAGAVSQVQGSQLRDKMYSALPFTKDPNIGPVAESVMQRLLHKGADQESALRGVKMFFERLNKAQFGEDFTMPNQSTADGFRSNGRQGGGQKTDWLAYLQGDK